MQYRVLRHFQIAGSMRKAGDLLDAGDVNNPKALMEQRYIAEAGDGPGQSVGGNGPTPDPKIAQDREVERAAGREVGPSDDVARDDKVLGRDGQGAEGGAGEKQRLKGKLAEDFPGHKPLSEAGFTTYAKVRKQLDTLEDIDGIGKATADKIREAFAGEASGTDDDETDADSTSSAEPGDSTVPKAPNAGDSVS